MANRQQPNLPYIVKKVGETDYFNHCRLDVLNQIPATARHILSVGCGTGATEAGLVERGIQVVGIELNPIAAQIARSRGLIIIEGDAADLSSEVSGTMFDCLIYADVLEHIVDPIAVLRSHVARLEPGGTVIISVPNFRHYHVFIQLFIRGHFKYAEAGIFDRTHLRITTRRMVEEWMRNVGISRNWLGYGMSQRREKIMSAFSFGILREFLARQVLIVGKKPKR